MQIYICMCMFMLDDTFVFVHVVQNDLQPAVTDVEGPQTLVVSELFSHLGGDGVIENM